MLRTSLSKLIRQAAFLTCSGPFGTAFSDPRHLSILVSHSMVGTPRKEGDCGFFQDYVRAQRILQSQRRSMFIQTQSTPNPQSLMFLPGRSVSEAGSREFPNARAAMSSPLAKRLFAIDGVTGIYFGSEFITVTKRDEPSWAVLKPDVFAAIMDHFSSGEPLILDEEALAKSDTAIHPEDDEVVAMIKELLETRIRPAVQEDGGDIVYKGFDADTGVVTVKMMGACSGCPSSAVTLKSGIENMLKHYIPEVKDVIEAGPEEYEEEGAQAFKEFEAKLEEQGEEEDPLQVSTPEPSNPIEKHLSA
ncbi:hypothetical protein CEUSTIGMA_g12225.t1 [Chlamydomonas eustigma]|uniref:Scaffold protein Nfu/NifU N-terminal domain-containing protein n=1 Tax=Chlamydomonas eustigma TaxID=1157962 RepID=A0A250XNZ5_9CHLO|nr:hypothetical protein CEUSTIGMA_g12225.t1 [Chlamydomonas eustigma]|eukprot:GAX84804.1 hypothetical protein CEUSTIGMA_g12225.t1 [Chlamydomonas eustigma]